MPFDMPQFGEDNNLFDDNGNIDFEGIGQIISRTAPMLYHSVRGLFDIEGLTPEEQQELSDLRDRKQRLRPIQLDVNKPSNRIAGNPYSYNSNPLNQGIARAAQAIFNGIRRGRLQESDVNQRINNLQRQRQRSRNKRSTVREITAQLLPEEFDTLTDVYVNRKENIAEANQAAAEGRRKENRLEKRFGLKKELIKARNKGDIREARIENRGEGEQQQGLPDIGQRSIDMAEVLTGKAQALRKNLNENSYGWTDEKVKDVKSRIQTLHMRAGEFRQVANRSFYDQEGALDRFKDLTSGLSEDIDIDVPTFDLSVADQTTLPFPISRQSVQQYANEHDIPFEQAKEEVTRNYRITQQQTRRQLDRTTNVNDINWIK